MMGTGSRAISRKIPRDGFALAAFFAVNARIRAGRVNKVRTGRPNFAASSITRRALR